MRLPIGFLVLSLTLSVGCSKKDDDDGGDSGTDITETGTPPNSAPVAVDDSASTWPGLAVEIEVLDNDEDPDDDPLEVTEVTQPDNGFVSINTVGNDTVTYTPGDSFVGVDTFTYTIIDGNGGSDSATVAVNVTDAPTLVITVPDEGEEVEGPEITIEFEVNGCNVSSPSSDPWGCHVHKYLDGEQYSDEDGTGHGHYTPASFTISPIADGEHTFMLYLISNDGSDAPFEPLISDSVTFTVTSSDTGGGGDDTGGGGDDTGGGGDDTGSSGDDTGSSGDDTGSSGGDTGSTAGDTGDSD